MADPRDNKGRWLPGVTPEGSHSANRVHHTLSKHVARYIADKTMNMEAIIDRLIEFAMRECSSTGDKRVAIHAMEILLDRGLGKPLQEVQLGLAQGQEVPVGLPSTLTDAQLEALAALDAADLAALTAGQVIDVDPAPSAAPVGVDRREDS